MPRTFLKPGTCPYLLKTEGSTCNEPEGCYIKFMRIVRGVKVEDADAIWRILEPMVRAGATYTLPREMSKDEALGYWMGADHEVFVAEEDGEIVGTYFLKANQKGGGAHVANCGYVTAAAAKGRGFGRMMCEHSMERARARAFRAMQFNFVVATNENAVRLWQSCGFAIVGRLPDAFFHPRLGYVDALVMYRAL
jgi:ribosomal protein S18 acetylase RimI-like enzyme